MKIRHALAIITTAFVIWGSSAAPVAMSQEPPEDTLKVLSSNEHGIVLELTVADFQVETVELGGRTFHRLIIPGLVQTDKPGTPQVPTRGTLLGLPDLTNVSVQILEADYETLRGYHLPPGPGIEITTDRLDTVPDEAPQPTFRPDPGIYAIDAFYPGQLVELGHTGYLRDQAVAQVQFFPVQYNPVTAEVHLYRRIRARVNWDTPLLAAPAGGRGVSPAYERVLKDTILNYDTLERPAAIDSAPPPDSPLPTSRLTAVSSSTDTLKIGVTENGLYQVTGSDLISAGFDPNGVDPHAIQINNQGAEVPIYVDGEDDGILDSADTILFYGTAITDVYTVENVYWLTVGQGNGQRMDVRDGTPVSATVPTHFPTMLHAEEDTYYWKTMPDGAGQDHWFWDDMLNAPASRTYSLTLNNISTTATTATVRVKLRGRTSASVNPDHHTKIYLNDFEIDDQNWDGLIIYDHEATVDHSRLNEGSNTITVESPGDTGAWGDQIYVNWIEVEYWDTYVAENDGLLFNAPGAGTFQFEVTGFDTDDVQVFDVTDPTTTTIITGTVVTANGGSYKLQFTDTAQPETRYLALTTAQRKAPARIEPDQPSSWQDTGNGADYIIITHEDFYTSSLKLASHRAITSGLRVATVKIEDVYDEFNYGIFNPQAIRDFLSYAYHNWVLPAPTYVLLVGDAYFDYKDNLGEGMINYVPSQIFQPESLGETCSDDWFVSVAGDDILPDMFIGRLTVQSSPDAKDMVDKIIRYEQDPPDGSWTEKVLLVADDGSSSDGYSYAYEIISDQIADQLPSYYTPNKVYARYYPPGDPPTYISNYINEGSILVSYFGHGNAYVWGDWGNVIYDRPDVRALDNTHKLPVVTAANCLNGYFVGASTSIAEEFLHPKDTGAVAVWASTSLGYAAGHRLLMGEFYDAIFQGDQYALGAATTAAKLATFGESSYWGDMIETFVLLGDPATKLGIPTNYPYVESTTPANGASDVSLEHEIQIVFNKPMSPTTVLLSGPGTTGLGLTPSWNADNTVLNYTHTGFDYNQTLDFTISGQDKLGNPLGPGLVPTTWSFTTPFAPTEVSVSGPTEGVVQVDYTFNAHVSPSATTRPITYTWQATDYAPITHTLNDLNDSVIFNWDTPGTKAITVTAANVVGTATETFQVTLDYSPPTHVEVTGATRAAIDTVYTFNAAVSPVTATLPLTYVWRTTGQPPVTHTGGGLNDSVDFTWSVTGTKSITVTATNAGGSFTQTHQVTVWSSTVDIAGPTEGAVQAGHTFTATVNPSTSPQPITYMWQATDQAPLTHTGLGLTDTASFIWNAPGTKTIEITATNSGGMATNNYTVIIHKKPQHTVFLPLVIKHN